MSKVLWLRCCYSCFRTFGEDKMKPFLKIDLARCRKVIINVTTAILFGFNFSSVSLAAPAESLSQSLVRTAASGLVLQAQLAKNINRQEAYQAQYTEQVPYQEQEAYTDYESYTEVERQCHTVNEQQCHNSYENQCHTTYENQCHTAYDNQCHTSYERECHTTNDRQCNTTYERECRNEQSCHSVPTAPQCHNEVVCHQTPGSQNCRDVEECGTNALGQPICKTRHVCEDVSGGQVCENEQKCDSGSSRQECSTEQVCSNVPKENCHNVPSQSCENVPRQVCENVPTQKCENVPRQVCENVPTQKCENIPHQVCENVTVTKQRPVTKYRTVTKYRSEVKCCKTQYRDVFDHQQTMSVEVRFPAGSELQGTQKEKFEVSLKGTESVPDVGIKVISQTRRYQVVDKQVQGNSAVITLGVVAGPVPPPPPVDPPPVNGNIDPHLGPKSIAGLKLKIMGDLSVVATFVDSGLRADLQTEYELVVKDVNGNVESTKQVLSQGKKSLTIKMDDKLSYKVTHLLELHVTRSGSSLQEPVIFVSSFLRKR